MFWQTVGEYFLLVASMIAVIAPEGIWITLMLSALFTMRNALKDNVAVKMRFQIEPTDVLVGRECLVTDTPEVDFIYAGNSVEIALWD